MPLLIHVHLHAGRAGANKKKDGASTTPKSSRSFSEQSMLGLCLSLEKAIQSIKAPEVESVWNTYYQKSCIYSKDAFDRKKQFISSIAKEQHPPVVWDLGCNTGEFSVLAAKYSDHVVAFDSDPACIERLYQYCRKEQISNILPCRWIWSIQAQR